MLPSGAAEWIALTFLERRMRNSRVQPDKDAVSRLVAVVCHLKRQDGNLRQLRETLFVLQSLNEPLYYGGRLAGRMRWTKNHFKQVRRRLSRLRDELYPQPATDFEELRKSYAHLFAQPTKSEQDSDAALLKDAHAQAIAWQRRMRRS